GTVCVVGKIRDLILQLSKSSIYSTKPAAAKKERGKEEMRLTVASPSPVRERANASGNYWDK
ncbi:hypothetical protein RZP48_22760, partial [Enterobacter asburiae]|nr:hypothetical protein [Enterobacter asburiae]MDV0915951.1 hypothetical protein [Enterobacter asburiae]MDV0935916.1 hypothetical protein [Enterobacter asburiae]MDV0946721.1 hypothetical protein [Enterobacter asburiae]MDV0992872.1 hypothetical protein [Enterobacter asburiae]